MTRLRNTLLTYCLLPALPFLLGAVSITIDTPASGSGAIWDCTTVDGTTTDCANGSPVSGSLFKWVNGAWSNQNPLGPLQLTATAQDGTWTTSPDSTLGTQSTFTATGDYKVEVTVTDNDTMVSDMDNNTWTIP